MEPKIYVACLSCYNGGTLHGEWIEATRDENDIYEEINMMLARCGSEEWAIHDTVDMPRISEYEAIADVSAIAEGMAEYGESFAAWVSLGTVALASEYMDTFESAFYGMWADEKDFARDEAKSTLFAVTGNFPVEFERYFDYDAYARDLFINDYVSVDLAQGGIAVFSRR